jgi:hypothetical protein
LTRIFVDSEFSPKLDCRQTYRGISMRIGRSLLAGGVAICLVAPLVMAQTGMVGFATGVGGGLTGEPYTATRKTTRQQTLADGTRINHETIVKEARDSAGRTYRESHPEIQANAEGGDFTNVVVVDPVNRITISWNSRVKQATIFHMPDPQPARSDSAAMPRLEPTARPPETNPESGPQIEKLGSQTIDGVPATGMRITRVIPAGRIGNDQPITITDETWRSAELRLVVRSVHDDPRTGLVMTELTDLQQGEPDPALFHVPEGYTVKEHFPQQNQN